MLIVLNELRTVLINRVTPVADAARHGHQGGLCGAPLAPGGQEHAPQAHQERQ